MKIKLETSKGEVRLELDKKNAPATVDNFLQYVTSKHYDGTIFHRVIKGFMVQGGGFDADMKDKPTQATIRNEANNGLSNKLGTVAMARTSEPHSASAQFFINTEDNLGLDFQNETPQGWGYCVFGRVIEGMETVYAIEEVDTTRRNGHDDVPEEPVTLLTATVLSE